MRAMTAFLDSVRTGDLGSVEQQLARQPGLVDERDPTGVSVVLVALYHGHPEVADVLVAAGADLDVFAAAGVGHLERLELLLDLDPALAGTWSPDGFTALHLAAFFARTGAAQRLLATGADPDVAARNPSEVRPLHSAAAADATEICRLLLDAGAAPDARQQGGYTPLHAAAQHGNADLVVLLLDRGADPRARTAKGLLPADLALEQGHVLVADRLAVATRS